MNYSMEQREIEIFFSDLNEEAQKIFLEAQGMKDPDEGNYDTFPIAVVPIPETEDQEIE